MVRGMGLLRIKNQKLKIPPTLKLRRAGKMQNLKDIFFRALLKGILITLLWPNLLLAQERGRGNIFTLLFPFLFLFIIFYLLLILPQGRAEKRRKAMLSSLKKGDRVVTTGGIYGTIIKLDENTLNIKIAENTIIKMERSAVRLVLKVKEAD